MNCPQCGLISPSDAVRCDCGYDFQNQEMSESSTTLLEHRKFKRWSKVALASGIVCFVVTGMAGIPIGSAGPFSAIHLLLFLLPGAILGSIAKSKKPKG